jgi:hypothetical protein
LRYTRGEWVADVFDNVVKNEPHICIYKGTPAKPNLVTWLPVKRIFEQMMAEGFFDRFQGRKMWLGYPEKMKPNGVDFDLHFTAVTPLNEENEDYGSDGLVGGCG